MSAGKQLVFAMMTVSAVMLAQPARAGKTHPFGWEDMFAMVRLADLQASPDGRWLLYSRTSYDVDKNRGNTDLEMVSVDGKITRRLTYAPGPDSNGRWSPDGRNIYFLSARSGSMQLWRLPSDGGEAEQVSRLPVEIDGFELSPDGKKVIFWSKVFPDCRDLECMKKRLDEKARSQVKARVFDSLFIRHWDTWFDGRRNHLFVMELAKQQPVDLMKGMDQDCPTIPWGGADELAWSPDSSQVAFTSKPSAGEAWHTNVEIYLAWADGRGQPRLLTGKNPAWDTGPRFSPDGSLLAYLAMDRPGYESDRFHIVVYDLKRRSGRALAADWDRSPSSLQWSADSASLYVTAEEHARRKIFAVDVATGTVKEEVSEGTNRSLQLLPDGRLAFLRDRLIHPREVFVYNPGNGSTRQVSRVNQRQLQMVRLSQPEEFWFENDGRRLHGWLLRPVNFRKGRRYPLAFLIHGGPQGSWLDDFHYRWNPQFYAGAGYVTVAIDFRGSTGYGQAFTDAIRGDWGPGPYSDLMSGLRYVLKKYQFIDKRKMCALGASFGGYMINWVAGQDHPFVCLVNHDGDFDTVSSYYSTEELWFPEWDMRGPPWKAKEVYEKNSPARFVDRWKTPMLVIQGARDFRVVEAEAFSTFNALQRRGIPSRLLYFPDENHWVLKPQNSRLWHRTVLEWLDRWTKTRR